MDARGGLIGEAEKLGGGLVTEKRSFARVQQCCSQPGLVTDLAIASPTDKTGKDAIA